MFSLQRGQVQSGSRSVQLLSRVPMDCSLPGSSAYGIFQARYCSGLPFPSPGDLPDPGIKPISPEALALAEILYN